MQVTKDQHLTASRKCLSGAVIEWSVTGEQAPGTNLRRSHIRVFLSGVGQHVPVKMNTGFAKFGEKKTLLGKRCVSAWKNLNQPSHESNLRTNRTNLRNHPKKTNTMSYDFWSIDPVPFPMRKNMFFCTLFAQSVASSWFEKKRNLQTIPVQVLNENQSLRIIDLKKNGITEQGALMLAEAPCNLNLIRMTFLHGNPDRQSEFVS